MLPNKKLRDTLNGMSNEVTIFGIKAREFVLIDDHGETHLDHLDHIPIENLDNYPEEFINMLGREVVWQLIPHTSENILAALEDEGGLSPENLLHAFSDTVKQRKGTDNYFETSEGS